MSRPEWRGDPELDRDDDRDYDEAPKKRGFRCGGYAAYDGHCGATDCETCCPGCTAEAEARAQEALDVLELDEEEEAALAEVPTSVLDALAEGNEHSLIAAYARARHGAVRS